MARTKISEFSSTPGNNTDIDGININEGCAPSGINDAIRELMSQLKDFQAGTAGDSFNGPIGTTTAAAGAFTTLSASSTVSGTGFSTYLASPPAIGGTAAAAGSFTTLSASSTVTLSGGTANGVLYLNGSKVATSGSALTFDGTTLQTSIFASTYGITVNRTGADGYLLIQQDGSGGGQIRSVSTGGLKFTASDASEWMRLTSTGLGIGTSSPGSKLTVSGDIQILSTNYLSFSNTAQQTYIRAAATSTLAFGTDSTERMRLDSSGNLGLGVTPSAWGSGYKAFQTSGTTIGSNSTGGTYYTQNAYYDGTNWVYVTTAAANRYQMLSGVHSWHTAASGTAGNAISFTQAMTLDASGNLLVGATSAASTERLNVVGGIGIRINEDGSGTKVLSLRSDFAGAGPAVNVPTNHPLLFQTNNTERARIDSSGNFGLGVTPSAWNSTYKVFNFGEGGLLSSRTNASIKNAELGVNWYRTVGGSFVYAANGYGTNYTQQDGAHTWYNAASGTAGNAISFTQAMTLDASGRLIIGTTSGTEALNVYRGSGNTAYAEFAGNGNTLGSTSVLYGQDTGSNGYFWNRANAILLFGTNNTERARITSGGDFLVGTTSTTGLDDGSSTNPGFATGSGTINLQRNNAANIFLSKASGYTSSAFVNFFVAGGAKGSITTDGTNVAYNTSSDYRLKDNPQPLTGSGAFIDALKPKTWTWKADGSKGVGFIAHEVQEVSPGSVVGEKDGEQMQAMEYGSAEFIANIIAELQSLRKRLADAGL